jgi:hypothetical protein
VSSLSPNSLRLGTWGLRGVMAQVFHHPNKIPMCLCVYIYIYLYINTYFTVVLRGGIKKWKSDMADDPKSRVRWSSQSSVPWCCKMRSAADRTSGANFGTWAMFWTGSMPRSTRTLEILMTYHDSRSASVARSPSIPSAHAWAMSSSINRSTG